jgi:hypothetical protein
MNAAFGVRFLPEDLRRLLFRPPFFAAFLVDFLAEDFRCHRVSWFDDRMRVATESETPSVRGANYSAVGRKQ